MNDEEIIIEQARLYLDGYSLRTLAKMYGVSPFTIRYNITKKLKNLSLSLYYDILEKLESNKPKTIKNEDIVNRCLNACNLLLNENKTIEEIATLLNSTPWTIYRDLTKRIPKIHEISPTLIEQKTIDMIESTLENNRLSNIKNHGKRL